MRLGLLCLGVMGKVWGVAGSGVGAVGGGGGDRGGQPHQAGWFLPVRSVEQRQLPGVSVWAGVENRAGLRKGCESDFVFFG